MTNNPYVQQLVEMGYDEQDCSVPASKREFPCVIHGRHFETEEQYFEELNEFLSGM